ncbi:YIP1 family protein [Streptomyces cyaneofuscatus]|uniref:YIP1 family protein n=1 Tax=Streptomyces cyaneofuscatus TaxID=66883 RepID=UPI003425F722
MTASALSPAPLPEAESGLDTGAKPPRPWLVMAAPGAVFQAVAEGCGPRRAVRSLLFTLPLMPVVFAFLVHDGIRTTLLDDPALADRAGAAGYLAVLAGVVLCVVQVALLAANYAMFAVVVGVGGATRPEHRTLLAVWAYACFPLILRQLCYVLVIATAGPDWLTAHAGAVGVADPFLIAVAVLFFIGCRKGLGLSTARSAVVTVLTTVIGAVGAIVGGVAL